jgi:transposase
MISFDNIEKLKEHKLSYIVGGRMASLKKKEIKHIHEEMIGLSQTAEEFQIIDGKSTRIQTARGLLICDFSMKRYLKDKREMEKQISRAENLIVKNTDGKRTKFLMLKQNGKKISKKRKKKGEKKERAYALNTKLIERTKLLLGIKGYYTNLFEKDEKLTNQDIINHYHNLWHVEKTFRIAKSDLAARPIFLRKRESIKAHILIVFVSLCLAKSIELKTGYSIQKVKDMIWGILDIKFEDTLTGKQFLRRMHTIGNPMVELLEKMKCG